MCIDVGGGPSGPSIEGPFCCTVHLCRTLGDRKIEKKSKKREKKIKKKEGKLEIREKEMRKKESCRDFVYFLCTSVFLWSFYALQIALLVVQLGSVVQWRAAEGLTPATALRR